MRIFFSVVAGLVGAASILFSASPAGAQSGTPFFAGRTINIYVGFTAGGNYDFYARLLAEFIGRHIPGNPQILVQNRPGAGSRNAANYVYNVAPKDGTAWATTTNLLPLSQVLDPASVRFDLTKAQWIGNMVELNSVIAVWHTVAAETLEDATKQQIIVGSTGRSGETYILPAMMNAVLGTKFKIVLGYPGINEIDVAMEKGELQGRDGSWANLYQQRPDWLRDKKVKLLVQIGLERDKALPNLPLLTELAKTDEQRAMLSMVSGYPVMSRAFYMPAEVPQARVKALRDAFDATMKDPVFLKAAKARNAEISPNSGEAIQDYVKTYGKLTPGMIAKARKALDIDATRAGKKKGKKK
jgi:tripartite-type tricarboxylate transporter receptor subunit TctC